MKRIELFMSFLLEHKVEAIQMSLRSELPKSVIQGLLAFSIASLSLFGFLIGISHSPLQAASSMIKLPLLFYGCAMVCFPTLYLFLALLGVRLNIRSIAQFMLVCLALTSVIILAFCPITLFFAISGTPYFYFKHINVLILGLAGFSGLYLFYKYLILELPQDFTAKERRRVLLFIYSWIFIYGIIGANMGFSISPVFGDPAQDFMLFTHSNENFFTHILHQFFPLL
ncbi:hypothetical protein GYB22_05395 [bacterium]|nr:hypothetical protein [bacterium]